MAIVAKIDASGNVTYVDEVLQDFSQPAPIPTLTPRQIRFVLNNVGLRQNVESMVSQADQTTKDWWEFSQQYEHDHPVLIAMANNLGLTSQQVEQMFIDGAKL